MFTLVTIAEDSLALACVSVMTRKSRSESSSVTVENFLALVAGQLQVSPLAFHVAPLIGAIHGLRTWAPAVAGGSDGEELLPLELLSLEESSLSSLPDDDEPLFPSVPPSRVVLLVVVSWLFPSSCS